VNLTPDELLSTTRAVRRRLDLEKPVEREVLEECLSLAQQAPSGGNRQPFRFVVVQDAATRADVARLYREAAQTSLPDPETITGGDPRRVEQSRRVYRSAWYLVDHLHEVPVHVLPYVAAPRAGGQTPGPGPWASVLPAVWSFMLAARSRGLGTVWAGIIVQREREVAELLGVPYDEMQLATLIPVAYTRGADFKPGVREPLDSIVYWDRWQRSNY
jgi:nitroreductase